MAEQFDIVIIGAGMGGLVCGAVLLREGYSVCIIEKNKQIGGCLQSYARDKVVFDAGVHYVGSLDKGQNLYQIFKYIGVMDKLKLRRMDMDAFDRILIEGDPKEYRFAQGYDNFIAQLLKDFPEEENAIRKYCALMQEVCERFPLYRLRSGSDGREKEAVLGWDTKTLIDSLTTNPTLRAVLAGNNWLYAGQPEKTPFYVHALILNHYIESAWKCLDGGSQIGHLIAREIRSGGGVIVRDMEVKRLAEENGQISFAELPDGSRVYGKKFISNIHPAKTLEMTSTDQIKPVYRKRIKNLENSISSFTINVVLKKDCREYINSNYYFQRAGATWSLTNYTEANWPLGWGIFFATGSKMNEYADGVTILTYMRFEEVQAWADTYNTVSSVNSRGETYEAFKQRKAEKLLDEVEKRFPGFRDCVDRYYTTTPLSFRDYIGNDDGSMYGIVKDYRDPLRTFISPRTKVPNLFLTGQNLNMHGVLGASMSGLVTSIAIMGNDSIIDKIKNA